MSKTVTLDSGCDKSEAKLFIDVAKRGIDPYPAGALIHRCACGPDGTTCINSGLASPKHYRTWHPQDLRNATVQINAILNGLKSHKPAGRELVFIRTGGVLMLAWNTPGYHITGGYTIVDESSVCEDRKRACGLADDDAEWSLDEAEQLDDVGEDEQSS